MIDRSHSLGGLALNQLMRVENLCGRFEADWQAGKRPLLEDYLLDAGVPEYKVLLQELILLDAEYRRQAGETPSVAYYVGRFPTMETDWLEDHLAATRKPSADPNAPLAATAGYGPPAESVGTLVAGRFKLLEQIGEGGMGTVWVAEQIEPVRRKVALKLIKAGMDSKTVLSRFEAERQALAMMDHPNIAKVLDGGTTESGRPFFAMEYVKGIPLTKYCDDARLSVADRLALFVPVCHAVQHAHQKGIIHRDLKPTNILVCLYDGLPVPKVIDFGLAKAMHQPLTELTLHTAHGTMMGTPLYMSPEQAEFNNLDVDTRTDIYALGVILYELLTGTTPLERKRFKDAAWQEMLRVIKEEEPPKPSARLSGSGSLPALAAQRKLEPVKLARLMRGELDWIVMKALEKDRARRYETANGFARDIQRYLADESVEASPPSARYRLGKFARKYRTALTTAGTILLLLLAGVGVSTWQAIRATSAEADANDQTLIAEKSAQTAMEQEQEAKRQARIAKENEERATKAVGEKDVALKDVRDASALGQILLAQGAFESGNIPLAREQLDKVAPDARRWEWQYLRRRFDGSIFTLWNKNAVASVALSPDGTRIATGTLTKINILDALSGEALLELNDLEGWIESVAFSPDGVLLTAGTNKGAILWDARTGKRRLSLDNQNRVNSVAFSHDSKRLVTSSGGTARIWDVRTGASLLEIPGHIETIKCVAFSPDDTRIATAANDSTAKVWDARTGTSIVELKGHKNVVSFVAFSPDGRRLVTASDDSLAKVWDANTGAAFLDLKGHSGYVNCVTYSPDGMTLATVATDHVARIWDSHSGVLLREFKGHNANVGSVSFSPDGTRIITGSDDSTVKSWDVRNGVPMLELRARNSDPSMARAVRSMALSADGTRLVIGEYDGQINVINAHNGTLERTINAQGYSVTGIACNFDGTRLASCTAEESGSAAITLGISDLVAKIWDARTGILLLQLKGHAGDLTSIAFSSDGSRLATGSKDGTAKIWDAATAGIIFDLKQMNGTGIEPARTSRRRGIPSETFAVSTQNVENFIPVLFGGRGRERMSATGGRPIYPPSILVAFNPDGKRLLTAGFGTLKVWDANSGKLLIQFKDDPEATSIAISPDGTRVVTGSWDGTAKIWDIHTGANLFALKVHKASISSVVFSPDGTRIATGSLDDTAKVWDARTGMPLVALIGHTLPVSSVAFSTDGMRLITGSHDQTVRTWDADNRIGLRTEVISPEERAYRQFWTRPRPNFHREEYAKALQAKDDFAANFHLKHLKQAVAADPRNAQGHFDLGLILQERKDLDGAIAEYREAIRINGNLLEFHRKLANALEDKKDLIGATAVYRQILALDPSDRDVRVTLFQRGAYQPKDNAERLELVMHCFGQSQFLTAARLSADALAADPKLANDPKGGRRYNAACYAARAASGQLPDANGLDERSHWRKQALDWLRADLAAYSKQLQSGNALDRFFVRVRLDHWQKDADLFSLRDQGAVAKLPAEERRAWQQLWVDVEELLRKSQEKAK